MALTETQVVANELEKVAPDVPMLFEREGPFYASIEKKNVQVISNRDMRIPLELRPGGNFGFFNPDGGDLGRADGPQFDKAVISTQHIKYGIEWTKKAEWSTDSDRKAVVNTLKHLLSKAMPEFRRHCDSLCMGAGDGVLGTIHSISTAGGKDTYTCDSDGFGVRLARFGQHVAVYQANLSAARTITPSSGDANDGIAAQIDLYDLANKKIRIKGAAGSVGDGDKLVWNGLSGANPVSIYGVPYHHSVASSGSWLGFTRSSTPEIHSNAVNASSSYLTMPFARLAMNKMGDRLGSDRVPKTVAWMHPCQAQQYEELGQLVSVINKTTSSEGLNLYFGDNMQLAGAPVRKHFSWDKTRIDFVNSSVWGRAEMHPAGFYEVDGRKIFEIRGASGGVATSQIFYVTASFNTFVNNPVGTAYIYGLAIPTGY